MDHEKELAALAAENLALSIIVGSIFSKFAKIPTLREAIIEGFDQSADVVDSVSMIQGIGSSPNHAVKALRIIEEVRAMVLGDDGKPKHRV
jgi:hypothetical protein